MTADRHDTTDAALDAWLQDAGTPQVPDALMARVLTDGLAMQPGPGGVAAAAPRRGWLAGLLGGWQSVGGLVAPPCAGFWIGLSPPQYLPQAALTLLVADQVDETTDPAEITAYGWVADEGADIDG